MRPGLIQLLKLTELVLSARFGVNYTAHDNFTKMRRNGFWNRGRCFRMKGSFYCRPVAQLGEHLLCKRETKFARTCRSRPKPLKKQQVGTRPRKRFLLFVRFAFAIYEDSPRLALRFYYARTCVCASSGNRFYQVTFPWNMKPSDASARFA